MSWVLVVGATSDIAKDLARIYAQNGYDLYLSARDSSKLTTLQRDLIVRSKVEVKLLDLDVSEFSSHASVVASLDPMPSGVIVASGVMFEQGESQSDFSKAREMIDVNYTGVVSLLELFASEAEAKKSGFIVALSSVAGDRGRASNYLYGSTKSALSAYLSGLRNRLHKSGVQVLTVKSGFVHTKMTAHLDLPPLLTASSQEIAKDIFTSQQKRKDVIYTKSIWFFIMLIIKHIPEAIFKKTNI
ncbi:MAG: SDR family oxidoreductase [Sulfuricurvum sp.]